MSSSKQDLRRHFLTKTGGATLALAAGPLPGLTTGEKLANVFLSSKRSSTGTRTRLRLING